MSKSLSQEAAENWIKKFFKEGDSDYVSIEEIFTNTGRENKPDAVNKGWLYNMMSSLKPFGYIDKDYEVRKGTRITKGIRLTTKGKQLMRVKPSSKPAERVMEQTAEVTFASVRKDVKALREKYPEFNVIFDARLKEEVDM